MAARLKAAFGADMDKPIESARQHMTLRAGTADWPFRQTTRSFVPPFLMATANDIEEWANTHESRNLLAVLLRMLVKLHLQWPRTR